MALVQSRGQGQNLRQSPQGTLSEHVNGKIIKQWDDGNAYCIELEDDERSNVWARSDTNTYVGTRDLRFMVGDKVQANVDGELLTESSPGNGKVTVSTVFSWRMGIDAVVEHRTILMLMSGSS